MRVLVTGSSGFIGSALVKKLTADGDKVTGIVRSGINGVDGVQIVKADLTSASALQDIDPEFDAVVHIAGLAHKPFGTPETKFFSANVSGTRTVARYVSKNNIKRFIHISSISVYNKAVYEVPIKETFECFPIGPYAVSKLKSEMECRESLERSGTTFTILRLSTVIGEGDPGNVLKLIKFIDSGRFLRIGRGANLKSFVYIGDVAEAIHAVLKCRNPVHDVYNVTASPISVNKIINILGAALGKKIPPFYIPNSMVQKPLRLLNTVVRSRRLNAMDDALNKWITEDAIDGERLSELFEPRITAEAALRREVEWYKNCK